MDPASASVLIWGVYLVGIGMILTLLPNILLRIIRYPETTEVWIRVAGIILIVLGYNYITAAMNGLSSIYWVSVYGRFGVFIGFAAFVALKMARPILLLFAAIDLAGALWTLLALTLT